MFLIDSLMISGIQWALKTVITAAEAEMNDDSALRERLMEAEMQREMGEITDDEFVTIEADLLKAIREIKERREGGTGAFAFGAGEPIEAGEDSHFQIEAELAGDFYGDVDRRDQPQPPVETNEPPALRASAEPQAAPRRKTPRTRTRRAVRTTRRT